MRKILMFMIFIMAIFYVFPSVVISDMSIFEFIDNDMELDDTMYHWDGVVQSFEVGNNGVEIQLLKAVWNETTTIEGVMYKVVVSDKEVIDSLGTLVEGERIICVLRVEDIADGMPVCRAFSIIKL